MASAQAQRRGRQNKLKNKPISGCGHLTPSRNRELPFEDPGTPGMDAERHGASSELEPAAPQPRRPFLVLPSSTPGSPDSADQATTHELRDLWDRGDDDKPVWNADWYLRSLTPDGEKGLDNRPLSSLSTCAGPTPCPTTPGMMTPCPEEGVASSLLGERSPQAEEVNPRQKGTQKLQKLEEGGGDRREVPSQSRKVFVGGVPQEMSQDDLYRFFNEHAPVKKAWLQKYRAASTANPSNNHRGFGFVIFMEAKAVDDLLGSNSSRFFYPPGGGKLEVKRAVSSSDMQNDTQVQAGNAEKLQENTPSMANTRTGGNESQAAPALGHEAVCAAPWTTMQMGASPQAIMVAPVPWQQGCPTVVQQVPAGYAVQGAPLQGMVKAAPNMTIPFQSDAQQMQCYGNPSMPRSSVGPTMAFAPHMQCNGPCMGGDGSTPQVWMASVPAQAMMQQPLQPAAQPVQLNPEVVQQLGQRISYWPQAMPASAVAAPGVVQRQQGASGFGRPLQGQAGMPMQQPQIDAYSVCNEAVTSQARNMSPSTAQATAEQLMAAMPEYYDD